MIASTQTALQAHVGGLLHAASSESAGNEARFSQSAWIHGEFSAEEITRLVRKLDVLRHEPMVSFSSTSEAIAYLRSFIRRRS